MPLKKYRQNRKNLCYSQIFFFFKEFICKKTFDILKNKNKLNKLSVISR